GRRAPQERVEPAPVAVAALGGRPAVVAVGHHPDALRLRREDARTADLGAQEAARRERDVAYGLGVGAQPRTAREPAVVGVARDELRRDARALPVRGGREDQALELLHAPAARDELERQPVEQLRMARALALAAEVLA